MDRISTLPPDHIIHQIMSYLSRKEVAQTNLLSKTWKNNLRPSFPILAFNHYEDFAAKRFPHPNLLPRLHWDGLFHRHPECFTESIEDFTRLVEATLVNFCGKKLSIQKFELHIGIHSNFEHWSSVVDKWIGLALENQVKDLDLAFWLVQEGLYPLPEIIFLAKSITSLTLHRCKLDHPSNNDAAFRGEVDTLWYLNLKKLLTGNPKHELLSSSIGLQQPCSMPTSQFVIQKVCLVITKNSACGSYLGMHLPAVALRYTVAQRSISMRLQLCPLLEASLERD
ncbi:hypothetical protein COLO4_21800 [Corchorus olitorius]|uniref:F-box domain-containing protein n=1 Tax=Corchorus olitorius TaxID=93759 RepID=A0A1R3IQW6_9ROSI|nr:hypothetical protein COLO4_21800 [Corchorus olitorius]